MSAIRTKLRTLRLDKRGATAIEYGLIAALICIGMLGGATQLGGGANGMWGKLNNATNVMGQ